jgi:hypothetical protein
LAEDAAFSLFDVGGPPGSIQVVKGHGFSAPVNAECRPVALVGE